MLGLCPRATTLHSLENLPDTMLTGLKIWRIVWYILTEAGSIIENAGALGAKIPGFLRKAIEALNDKVESAGDIDNDK